MIKKEKQELINWLNIEKRILEMIIIKEYNTDTHTPIGTITAKDQLNCINKTLEILAGDIK